MALLELLAATESGDRSLLVSRDVTDYKALWVADASVQLTWI